MKPQATQAQAMLVVYTPGVDETQPALAGDSIIVVRGPLPLDALAMMGLTPVPVEDDGLV